MRRQIAAIAAGAAVLSSSLFAAGLQTRTADDTLTQALFNRTKVTVGSPEHSVFGSGVWLGQGHVLTANHMFREYKKGDPITVAINGRRIPATLRAQGDLNEADLALLDVDRASASLISWQGPMVCSKPESVAAALQVISFDQGFNTFAAPEHAWSSKDQVWSERTTATFSPGVSGSPVFDVSTGCLAGIISHDEVEGALVGDDQGGQAKCIQATRQGTAPPAGVTCMVSAYTQFSALDRLRVFLNDAGVSLKPTGR